MAMLTPIPPAPLRLGAVQPGAWTAHAFAGGLSQTAIGPADATSPLTHDLAHIVLGHLKRPPSGLTVDGAVPPPDPASVPLPIWLQSPYNGRGQQCAELRSKQCSSSTTCKTARAHRSCCSFVFNIPPSRIEEFQLVPRLIGKGGANMKPIVQACNGKIRIRGRGSGFAEGKLGEEAGIPLQLSISCDTYEDFEVGRNLLVEALDAMATRYANFCRKKQVEAPSRFYTIRGEQDASQRRQK